MISGRPPFTAAELSALLFAIVHNPPEPLHGGTAGPAVTAVEEVLLRALAKRQADRFATVSAFVRALEAAAVTTVATTAAAPVKAPATPAPAQPAKEKRTWGRGTRWAALDPQLVLQTLHIRRAGPLDGDDDEDGISRRRWPWVFAAMVPVLAAAAFWFLTERKLPFHIPLIAPERARAVEKPLSP
jgi:hypothetical protein